MAETSPLEQNLAQMQIVIHTPGHIYVDATLGDPSPSPSPPDTGNEIISRPEDDYLFSFSVMPGSYLKNSIAAMAEPDLNSTGLARIDVTPMGFEMTVRDFTPQAQESTEVTGFLSLKARSLIDFTCQGWFVKMIKLDDIVKFLDTAEDRVAVRVFSVDGTVLSVEFLEITDTGVPKSHNMETSFIDMRLLKRFPTLYCAFEQTIPSDKLRPLLTSILADMSNDELPKHGEARLEQTVRIKAGPSEVTVKDEQHMWFVITSWLALEKASRLSDTCLFYLARTKGPVEHILLRFPLKEVGDFYILKPTQACIIHLQPKFQALIQPRTYTL